jgi:hypothetical protein
MPSQRHDKPIPRVSARKYRGAGDVVERIAKPVARMIDRTFGTNLVECPSCAKRRETLNRILPLKD